MILNSLLLTGFIVSFLMVFLGSKFLVFWDAHQERCRQKNDEQKLKELEEEKATPAAILFTALIAVFLIHKFGWSQRQRRFLDAYVKRAIKAGYTNQDIGLIPDEYSQFIRK